MSAGALLAPLGASAGAADGRPAGGGGRWRLAHLPGLDGLRGLAVAAVLAYHDGRLPGGFLGVDLFFTLSGFLITALLLAEWRATGKIDLGAFWARRARRLLPAIVAVLGATAAYAAVAAGPAEAARWREEGLAALFYVANWHAVAAGTSYWDAFFAPSPLRHFWSLAVEEQFYLAWPPVALGVLRWRRGSARALLGVAVALGGASAAAMVLLHRPGADSSRVYFGSDTRAASILVGAALAAWLAWRGPVASRAGRAALEALAAASLVGLVLAWSGVDERSAGLFEGGLVLCALGAAAVVAAAASPEPGPVARALSLAPLRALGRTSYGLYLWHWPVYALLTPARTGASGWALTALRVVVSLAVAEASYRLVEQPVRRGALAGWRARVAAPVAVAAVAAALVVPTSGARPPEAQGAPEGGAAAPEGLDGGAVGSSAPGGVEASATGVAGVAGVAGPALPPGAGAGDGAVATPAGREAVAELGAPATPVRRVMVAGDSVALTVGAGAEAARDELGIAVLNRGGLGCGLTRGTGRVRLRDRTVTEAPGCRTWPERWAKDAADFRPDVAVLAIGAWDAADHELDGDWVAPCDPAFEANYAAELDEAVRALGGGGGTVVAVATAPYLRSGVLGLDEAEADRRVDCLNRAFRAAVARSPGARLVDLAAWACPTRDCRTEADGVELRPDGVHYSEASGPLVAHWLLSQLRTSPGVTPATP